MDARTANTMLSLLASQMNNEEIVEKIEEAVTEFKMNPNDETFEKLAFSCTLVMQKLMLKNEGGGIDAVMKQSEDFDKVVKAREMFNPKKS